MTSAPDDLVNMLQDALSHLYDPAYQPPAALWRWCGLDPDDGVEAFQRRLVREIRQMEPGPDIPANARSRRIFGLLFFLYVEALTQEDAAERLCITARHVRRDRTEAVRVLATRLGDRSGMRHVQADGSDVASAADSDNEAEQAGDWQHQFRREVASLQAGSGPGITIDLKQVVSRTAELALALITKRGIELEVADLPMLLSVQMHPSLLRQALIASITELAQAMAMGAIRISVHPLGDEARITVRGEPVLPGMAPNLNVVREMVLAQGGAVGFEREAETGAIWFQVRCVSRRVLIVDDNLDMVHLYRRYVQGTPYHLTHCDQGSQVLNEVAQRAPDIIVLDVMLPDTDGWELLSRLRQEPRTRDIPIMVCSVVREEDLAFALGADACLSKPIDRRAFLDALDGLALSLGEHNLRESQ